MQDLADQFRDHEEHDDNRFTALDGKLEKILNNHLAHMEPDLASMKADMVWVKWGVLAVAGVVITAFLRQ